VRFNVFYEINLFIRATQCVLKLPLHLIKKQLVIFTKRNDANSPKISEEEALEVGSRMKRTVNREARTKMS